MSNLPLMQNGFQLKWEKNLRTAILFGFLEDVKSLIASGANVDEQDQDHYEDGRTALHWASGENHIDIAKELIEAGANVNIRDNDGNTPLGNIMSCCDIDGFGEMIALLKQNGAIE